jgi:hypothetical protein
LLLFLIPLCYTTAKGEPRTARLEITLPLALFCKIVPPIKTSVYKLTIDTGRRGAALLDTLFKDLQPQVIESGRQTTGDSEPDAPNIISFPFAFLLVCTLIAIYTYLELYPNHTCEIIFLLFIFLIVSLSF